jgi:hypothetical protein
MSRKKSPRANKGFPQAVKRRHIFDSFAARLNVVPFPILARPEFVPTLWSACRLPVLLNSQNIAGPAKRGACFALARRS